MDQFKSLIRITVYLYTHVCNWQKYQENGEIKDYVNQNICSTILQSSTILLQCFEKELIWIQLHLFVLAIPTSHSKKRLSELPSDNVTFTTHYT